MPCHHVRAVLGAFVAAAFVAAIVVIGSTATEGDAQDGALGADLLLSGNQPDPQPSTAPVEADARRAEEEARRAEAFADAVRAHEAETARQLEALAAAEEAAALEALARAQREASSGIPDSYWDRMAQCETGGNWSMVGSRYSGGLGFYNGTWDAFGGREFAARAGQATREQQIVVANRIANEVGLSGWGCLSKVGRP